MTSWSSPCVRTASKPSAPAITRTSTTPPDGCRRRRCATGRAPARHRNLGRSARFHPLRGWLWPLRKGRFAGLYVVAQRNRPLQIAQAAWTRYLAARTDETASVVEEERGRSWGGSTARNTFGRRSQGSETGGRSVSGGGVAMRGTFVASRTIPTSPQSVLNISPALVLATADRVPPKIPR